MILIDSSAWIEFFRGTGRCADAVDSALALNEAVLCGPVITELRRGLRAAERRKVLPLLEGCELLEQPDDLWVAAGDLGNVLAAKGVTAKTFDLLIATYALSYRVAILARDRDFQHMRKAGIPLMLELATSRM